MRADPTHDERRPLARAALSVISDGDTNTLRQTTDHLAHLQRQVVVEAVLAGYAATWERRARALEAARPVPGDFTGKATREDLSAAWRRLTEAAAACRARARLTPRELIEAELGDVLEETAC